MIQQDISDIQILGQPWSFAFTLLDENGALLDLTATGTLVNMTFGNEAADLWVHALGSVPGDPIGQVNFSFTSTQTNLFPNADPSASGTLDYQVNMTSPSGVVKTYLRGQISFQIALP